MCIRSGWNTVRDYFAVHRGGIVYSLITSNSTAIVVLYIIDRHKEGLDIFNFFTEKTEDLFSISIIEYIFLFFHIICIHITHIMCISNLHIAWVGWAPSCNASYFKGSYIRFYNFLRFVSHICYFFCIIIGHIIKLILCIYFFTFFHYA